MADSESEREDRRSCLGSGIVSVVFKPPNVFHNYDNVLLGPEVIWVDMKPVYNRLDIVHDDPVLVTKSPNPIVSNRF